MISCRLLPIVLLLLAGGGTLWWFTSRPAVDIPPSVATAQTTPSPPAHQSTTPSAPSPAPASADGAATLDTSVSAVSAELNSPKFDVTHDLVVLNNVFTNWRLDFPNQGNPFGGDNAEITRALAGENPLRLAYIPRAHPALNAAGELCDRWGTPFRFHALSGTRMELRSAGPDKKFGTADDALLTPP